MRHHVGGTHSDDFGHGHGTGVPEGAPRVIDPRTLPQGTIIQVKYLDWAGDPTGDTRKADVLCKTLFCVLWEVKRSEKFGIDVLVATGSSDPDGPHEQGYYAWPLSTVVGVEVIRRPRTPRKRTKTVETGG